MCVWPIFFLCLIIFLYNGHYSIPHDCPQYRGFAGGTYAFIAIVGRRGLQKPSLNVCTMSPAILPADQLSSLVYHMTVFSWISIRVSVSVFVACNTCSKICTAALTGVASTKFSKPPFHFRSRNYDHHVRSALKCTLEVYRPLEHRSRHGTLLPHGASSGGEARSTKEDRFTKTTRSTVSNARTTTNVVH